MNWKINKPSTTAHVLSTFCVGGFIFERILIILIVKNNVPTSNSCSYCIDKNTFLLYHIHKNNLTEIFKISLTNQKSFAIIISETKQKEKLQ